jgi:hypothetical protein
MNLKDAIDFWVTESGYRRIQNALSRRAHAGTSKYALASAINTTNTTANTINTNSAIEALTAAMETASAPATYYRGSPSGITETHRREGFFAVAPTAAKATSYGTLYTVRVDADVPRLRFAAEGGEVLLAPGMIYEYPAPKTIRVRTPKTAADASIPFLGDLYASRAAAAAEKSARDQKYLISRLYCYSLVDPDPDLGYLEAECPADLLADFEKKPIDEQIAALKERLTALKTAKFLDGFKTDIPLFFPEALQDQVPGFIDSILSDSLVGGRRRRHRTQKKKRTHRRRKY